MDQNGCSMLFMIVQHVPYYSISNGFAEIYHEIPLFQTHMFPYVWVDQTNSLTWTKDRERWFEDDSIWFPIRTMIPVRSRREVTNIFPDFFHHFPSSHWSHLFFQSMVKPAERGKTKQTRVNTWVNASKLWFNRQTTLKKNHVLS